MFLADDLLSKRIKRVADLYSRQAILCGRRQRIINQKILCVPCPIQ